MKPLEAERLETPGMLEAIEACYENGWTDGLPVIPATESRVREFLDYAGLPPDHPLGEVPERALTVTAEYAAVSAVMAGCKPEYFPIVVAALEAITDPKFHFNHLASLASPWPLLIVNGPIGKRLNINSGMYVFGCGNRANATIGRALGLFMWNYAEARPGGVLRGQMGHPGRYSFCIAENEDTPWLPLHVLEGYEREQSTVTALSSTGAGLPVRVTYRVAEAILDHLAAAVACHSFDWGTYAVVVSPGVANTLAEQGWSKERARDYIKETARRSVADLKRCGHWDWWGGYIEERDRWAIRAGDESEYVHLFRDKDKYGITVFPEQMKGRRGDVFLVVAGGDVGPYCSVVAPYPITSNPVTRLIREV